MLEKLQELQYWVDFYQNRPIRDPLMFEFLRAAQEVLDGIQRGEILDRSENVLPDVSSSAAEQPSGGPIDEPIRRVC